MQHSFKNLPFVPAEGQVIYAESACNNELNLFICNNYEWLQKMFRASGLTLCYLPLLAEEVMRYHAPHLSEEQMKEHVERVPSLADFAVTDLPIAPSLFFAVERPLTDDEGNVVLHSVEIKTSSYEALRITFLELIEQIEHVKRQQKNFANRRAAEVVFDNQSSDEPFASGECFGVYGPGHDDVALEECNSVEVQVKWSKTPRWRGLSQECFCSDDDFLKPDSDQADRDFDYESQKLIAEIKERISALRMKGVNTLFLRELIDERPRLSRVRITKDFRVILVDYNELEIQMSLLPKAVFFLFLRHPEGIRFKELSDYADELLQIYEALNPNGNTRTHRQSIQDVTDATKNSINEKCARIREAFLKHFDERLARFYFVTGQRGEPKCITLDRSLVSWD